MAKKSGFPSALLLFLLVVTGERLGGVEARTCGKSSRFQGTCVRDSNCDTVCETEGYSSGVCRGDPRRCYCYWTCD